MKSFFRTRPAQIGLAALALLNFAHAGVMAQGVTRAYFANDPVGRNVVSILSSAPLETMLTTTGQVEAEIKINPNNVLDNPQARFRIPVASLDTGIKVRNEHMMEAEWLDAAKYPNITFTLLRALPNPKAAIAAPSATPGAKGAMTVEGELDFHGVKKIVTANVEVEVIGESEATKARLAGELMHIRASFPLKLDDFGVVIPETAKLKVAGVQDVKVDVFVSTGSKAPAWSAPVAAQTKAGERAVRLQSPSGPIRLAGRNEEGVHFPQERRNGVRLSATRRKEGVRSATRRKEGVRTSLPFELFDEDLRAYIPLGQANNFRDKRFVPAK